MFTNWRIRLLLFALLGSAYSSTAEDRKDTSGLPTYRSTVSEVRVTFFATDENNHPVTSLTKSDLAAVDNEQVIRNFRSFTHSDETMLDVVVLVDLSESVAPRFRAAMSDVLELVAREQSIPDDNISVLSFGGTLGDSLEGKPAGIQPVVLCSSGCRTSDSASRLSAVKSSGATPLFDALVFAADFISHHRRDGVRPVVILFSDGDDTISLHSQPDALQAMLDAGALIYSVDIGTNQTSGSRFLRQVSEATGGLYFPPHASLNGAATVLNSVLEDLHASYVVTYDLPSREAGFHSLRLLPTHNLNLTFHSRYGYDYDYEPSAH